jgi:hypothetical protein
MEPDSVYFWFDWFFQCLSKSDLKIILQNYLIKHFYSMARLFGTPALFFNEDGRLELFVVGVDGSLYELWQVTPNGPWSGWYNSGQAAYQPPGLCATWDQRLEVFVGGGSLLQKWQTAINNGWSGWVDHGSPPNPPSNTYIGAPLAILSRRNDCVYVFATDEQSSSGVWYINQTAENTDNFSGWNSLGNPLGVTITGPPGAGGNDGLLQIFAVGADNALWSNKQNYVPQPVRHTVWSGWFSLGIAGNGFSDRPAISPGADGRNEVFVIGTDGSLYHIWQTNLTGAWSGWYSHGNPGAALFDHPEIAYPSDGRLIVFAVSNGEVYYLRQVAQNNGWSGWMSLGVPGGGAQSAPAACQQENGLLLLCVTAADGSLWNIAQTDPDNWAGWLSVGQP